MLTWKRTRSRDSPSKSDDKREPRLAWNLDHGLHCPQDEITIVSVSSVTRFDPKRTKQCNQKITAPRSTDERSFSLRLVFLSLLLIVPLPDLPRKRARCKLEGSLIDRRCARAAAKKKFTMASTGVICFRDNGLAIARREEGGWKERKPPVMKFRESWSSLVRTNVLSW